MKLHLTINGGSLTGRRYDLETGFLTVGRSDNCSVRFDPVTERIASKQHAFIEARPDGFFITDNQSTNGTFVNEQPIESSQLHDGDVIRFGKNGVTARVDLEQVLTEPTSDITHDRFTQASAEHWEQAANR